MAQLEVLPRLAQIRRDAIGLFRPPTKLTVAEWAEQFRYLPRGTSPEPGRYSFARTPFAREPMEAITDPHCSELVLLMAKQITKSEVLLNAIGFFIDSEPCPILCLHPTLDMAKKFSRSKLAPMIRECPSLRNKVADPKTRNSSNTLLAKVFLGGDITIAGANSEKSLRQESRRVVIQDDIDAFGISAGREGDPCALADGRAENFSDAVLIKASTPTVKGSSRIENHFQMTDQRYFFVPCLRCAHWQKLKWSQVAWPKDAPEKAFYVCENCRAELTDWERIRMIAQGQWRPTYPHRRRRGYHLSGLYRMMGLKIKEFSSYLHEFAVRFMDADHGGRQTLQAWVNTFLAETWEEKVKQLEIAPLLKRTEDYKPDKLPNEIILLLAAVDVQKTWLQVEVMGLGLQEETWGVETKIIQGDPEQDDVWQDLADALTKKYRREDGLLIEVIATAIDMRSKGRRVRNFIRTCGLPHVYPVFGLASERGSVGAMLVSSRFNKHYQLRTYGVDTKLAKDTVFARLEVQEPGPRYQHFPAGHGYNEEFFAQLGGEALKTRYVNKRPVFYYDKIRERNDALDIRVYLLAAIDILNPNLTAIVKRQSQQAAPAQVRAKIKVGGFGGRGPQFGR